MSHLCTKMQRRLGMVVDNACLIDGIVAGHALSGLASIGSVQI